MGFWSWLLKDDLNTREETITPPVSDVLLKALLSNEVITREKALTLPVVSGAVDFITNSVASMPVKLYKVKQGKVEEMSDDPRVKLLNGDTGDTLDAFQLKKAMVEDYLLGKGGYCYIQRDRNDVVALRYVEDRYITILKNFKPIYKDYVILVEGAEYQPYEFIKLLRNTKDGGSGVGLTAEVSKALETAYQTLLYQLSQVQAGGNKKGFLKSQRTLGQEEINALKKAWKNMYGNGTENVVVLNNGIEFQESGASAMDMQLDQNKNTLRSEINYIFHINEGNFELTFKEAIYPIIKAFETALNRDLLLEKEKKNHFFEFDVKEIVKASLIERYNAYKTAKETGWLSYNEIRKMENMEYVEGLDVVNVGLGAVLYDINTHKYYTPNTDTVSDPNDGSSGGETPTEEMNTMLEHHEEVEAFDESGNDVERQIRYNDVHDGKTGRFGTKSGVNSGDFFHQDMTAQVNQFENAVKDPNLIMGFKEYSSGMVGADQKKTFDEKYGISEFIDNEESKDLKVKNNPALYRGGTITDEEFKSIKVGEPLDVMNSKDQLTSWSDREMVAHMYAEESKNTWGQGGNRPHDVVIVDKSKTSDGIVMPYTFPQNEVLRSKNMSYTVTKIEKNSKPIGRENESSDYYNSPITYIYVESKATNKRADNLRFNENHDGKTGRFAPKSGSGGGGVVLSDEDKAKLADLENQLAEAKGLFAKSAIKTQMNMINEGFKGTIEEYNTMKQQQHEKAVQESLDRKKAEKAEKERKEAEAKKQLEEEMKTQPKEKVEQFKIIQENNPMNDDYHVGIRKPSDIKTWKEVVDAGENDGESFAWGDFSKKDAQKALESGKIKIYSSNPIGQGGFVSTSKIQAEQYAGGSGNKVYSKTVPLEDVAWINGDEGQFAKRKG